MCLNIGIPNNHHFPFGTNGKVVVSGVPILKHFRVLHCGRGQSAKEANTLLGQVVSLSEQCSVKLNRHLQGRLTFVQ